MIINGKRVELNYKGEPNKELQKQILDDMKKLVDECNAIVENEKAPNR